MRRPFLSGKALPALTWGLPFHIVLMAFLFGGLGLSEGVVRAVAAWKEVAVVSFVIVAAARALLGSREKMEITVPDLLVLSLFATAFCYLLFDGILFGAAAPGNAALYSTEVQGKDPRFFASSLPGPAALYGIRDSTFFMLLYFVGRATPEIGNDYRVLKRFTLLAVVTSIVAVFELIFVTPDMLVYLGATTYFQDFLGVTAFTTGNDYGLPQSYWSRLGNTDVRRAGSVYLSGQGFAVPFLLLLPAATVWVFGREKRPGALQLTAYALVWAGLLLTLTRMTIIACLFQVFFYLLWKRKPQWAVAGGIVSALGIVGATFVLPSLLSFMWQTLTWQTGSSATHVADWTRGLVAFGARPWGWGLGTTDLTAIRTGLEPLAADNQYLKYAVEMGLPGLLTHVGVLLAIMIVGIKLARETVSLPRRLLAQAIVLATLGIMLNAMTAVVFNAMVLSYLYFWIAGSVVSLWQLERGRYRAPAFVTAPAHA